MSQLTEQQEQELRDYIVSQPDLKALASDGRDADIVKALQEVVGSTRSNVVGRDLLVNWIARRAKPAKMNVVHQIVLTSMERFDLGDQFLYDMLSEVSTRDGQSELAALAGKEQTRAESDLGFEVKRHQQVSRALRPIRRKGKVTQL